MSTQEVTDYLTKQLFIERNIVTYRSLSRQFSIHVNTAKNELATYHHNTFYQAQNCSATYFLSGTIRGRPRVVETGDGDVDMGYGLSATQEAGEEDDDGEEVPQTKITLVNQNELEDAKALYDTVDSVHVYCLSPAPIHDAGLICAPADDIRKTDKTGGSKLAATVGRVVCTNIKMTVYKKGKQPAAPVAGPSKLKQQPNDKPSVPEQASKAQPAPPVEKAKAKAKSTGKMEFFMTKSKDEKPKEEKPPVVVKKEPANTKNIMFFSKGPSRSPSIASEYIEPEQPSRGVKRKSSIALEKARAKTPEVVKVKKRVILSDDDGSDPDTAPKQSRRQAQISKAEKMENDAAQREALALMDIDDDQVEKVSRTISSNINLAQEEEEEEGREDTKASVKADGRQDEDIDMVDETASKPAHPKKREKKVIPLGRNGLKKRKVMKTRRTTDGNGYMRTEDYSDWESVDEDAESEPAKPKRKTKPAIIKKEEENVDDLVPAPAQPEEKKAATKAPGTKAKGKSAAGGKPQKGLLNFFGPPKK